MSGKLHGFGLHKDENPLEETLYKLNPFRCK